MASAKKGDISRYVANSSGPPGRGTSAWAAQLLLGESVDQTLTDSPQSADDAADVAFGTCFGRRS